MNKTNYKSIKPVEVDPITGVTKEEYDAYLNEYLNSSNNIITMINPNLIALFMSIAGPNKAYSEDEEKNMVTIEVEVPAADARTSSSRTAAGGRAAPKAW